jgi:16S rRNA processing protein RimM
VQGWVGVETYTEAAGDLVAYGEFADEAGTATFAIDEARMGPKGLLVRFAGVSDRNAAEALKGTRLCVPRASLPKIREKESYYHADLIGLAAARTDGAVLGRVVAVQNFGAGDLLEIAQPGNPNTLLVPFTQAIVPEVDVKAGRVVIDPPPGLLDSPATGGARTEHGPGEQDGADE